MCLHGFPDTPHTWRFVAPALVAAGYRVVAPWLRGYAPTAIPADGVYDGFARGADANALHAALGGDERAVLIGHDWGALTAYAAAAAQPENWSKVVTLSVPPPASMASKRTIYAQLKRSWYIYFFQRPNAPDVARADDFAFIANLLHDWSPNYDFANELPYIKAAMAGDHANAAIAYYLTFGLPNPLDPPPQPTLYLHGIDDGCLDVGLMHDVLDFLPNPNSRFEQIPGGGHFLQLEQPARVSESILAFLGR